MIVPCSMSTALLNSQTSSNRTICIFFKKYVTAFISKNLKPYIQNHLEFQINFTLLQKICNLFQNIFRYKIQKKVDVVDLYYAYSADMDSAPRNAKQHDLKQRASAGTHSVATPAARPSLWAKASPPAPMLSPLPAGAR